MTSKLGKAIGQLVYYFILLLISFITIIPIIWIFITSIKSDSEILRIPVVYFPNTAIWENYSYVWEKAKFSQYFFNSIFIASTATIIVIIFSILLAYGLSRFNFKGKGLIMTGLLLTQFLPGIMLLVPLFIILTNIGLINTLTGLILVFVAFDLPFCALLLRNFANNIPIALEEAAMLDGCNNIQILFRIIFPLLFPGAVAIGVFSFLGSWNEFLFPLILISDPIKFTVSIGLGYMKSAYATKYAALAAGAVISLTVPLTVFAIMQKYLIDGLTSGSVKG
jgi:multiple sugar transport system permease protein